MPHRNFHDFDLASGHGLRHDPFGSIVGPRVIGWIGSRSASGQLNLAPYSFCTIVNYRPPVIAFASVGNKDSVRHAIDTGVFTWNLATRSLAEAMNQTSIEQDVQEFEFAGLTPRMGRLLAAPYVDESPVALECRVTQHLRLRDAAGAELDTWMVFGEVVAGRIDTSCIVDGVYQTAAPGPILRAGGPGDYFEISDSGHFFMRRP